MDIVEQKRITEARNELVTQSKAMITLAETEKRGFSAEERTKYDRLLTDIAMWDVKLSAPEERALPQEGKPDLGAGGDESRGIDVERAGREKTALLKRAFVDYVAAKGREMGPELRALTTASGILLPINTLDQILTKRVEFNFMRYKSRVYTFHNNTNIPIRSALGAAQIIAEGSPYPTNDSTIANTLMHAYKLGNIFQATDEQIQDAAASVVADFQWSAALTIAKAELNYFLNGTGSGQPTGIFTGGTATQTTAVSGAIAYADLIAFDESLDPVYRDDGIWVMHPTTSAKIRELVDSYGRPLWLPDLTRTPPVNGSQQNGSLPASTAMLFGKPVFVSNYAPTFAAGGKAIALANLAYGYAIADREGFEVKVLEELYAGSGTIGIRYAERVDGEIMLADAVQVLTVHI